MVELEHETRWTLEPVVLIHAGICAGWFKPLLEEPALAGRHRLVSYSRSATPAAIGWTAR